MFKLIVDDEINLYLVNESFACRYFELVEENYDYLAKWLEWPRYCKTEVDFKEFIRGSLHKYADKKCMDCAIEFRGEIVGNSGFNIINHNLQKAEIGYWIGQSYQGNGIITRVCRYLINYAFSNLEIKKVQISAAEGNIPSRAVCERLNMKLEGILTNQEKVGGKILSHAIYAAHKAEA